MLMQYSRHNYCKIETEKNYFKEIYCTQFYIVLAFVEICSGEWLVETNHSIREAF